MDNLSVFFLAQGEQTADAVMARLSAFIHAAQETLDVAVYDLRFSDPLRTQFASALHDRAQAGVRIRFCYDGDKPLRPKVVGNRYRNHQRSFQRRRRVLFKERRFTTAVVLVRRYQTAAPWFRCSRGTTSCPDLQFID